MNSLHTNEVTVIGYYHEDMEKGPLFPEIAINIDLLKPISATAISVSDQDSH
jgi:hypothetical protein